MTNKKSTKRALLLSALSLLLCVSMLIGSTFAWFTDEVTSSGNKIISGKLDVDLIDASGKSLENETLQFVDKDGKEILTQILWEPGCTYKLEPVKVKNNGNLWLKYEIVISGIEGNAKLLEAIEWKVEGAALTGTLEPDATTDALQITGHMKEEAGNEYQGLEMDGISITVYATQMNAESDSFGPDYDKSAPLLVWDGSVDTSWYDASVDTYELSSPAKLAGLAELVNGGNSFAGKTIKLAADMDLNNIAWKAIGTGAANFNGKFYGNGFTIYNLNVSGTEGVGLIAFAGNAAHIEGVHIVGANVKGEHYVGAVLGYGYLAADCLKNCVVENAIVYAGAGAAKADGDKVGAIAGWTSNGNIIGNKAIDCKIYGCRDMGGIVGYVNGENRAVEVSGNTVENVTISVIAVDNYSEPEKMGTNINDTVGRTGSSVTVKNNSGKITKETNAVVAATSDELKAAAAEGGEVVVVAGNYKFPANKDFNQNTTLVCSPATVFEGNSGLNINGATVVGATFSNDSGNAVGGTINGTFKDCDFTGYNALRGCYAGETVVFEDCTFSGDVYGIHFDGGKNDVIFRRCVFSGFNAMGNAISKLTMEDCTFKPGKSAYNGINLWGNTDMTNCTFVFDGTKTEWIDLCSENITGTFTDCVVTDGTNTTDIAKVVTKRHDSAKIIVDNIQVVTSNDNLKAAVAAGATKVLLADGEYDLNGIQKDGLTLIGVGNEVKVANTTRFASGKAVGAITKAIKMENVTITNTVYTMENGSNATFTNVYFAAGFRQGYGKAVVFTDCTFGSNSEGYALHFQTDAASEGGLIKLNGCKFEGGKVHLGGKRAYEFTNCDFAAGTDFQVWSNITLDGCTVDGAEVTAANVTTMFPKLDTAKVTIK